MSRLSSLIALGILIGVILGALFVTQPLRSRVNDLRTQTETLQKEKLLREERNHALLEAQTLTADLSSQQKEQLLQSVPPTMRQDQLIVDLRALSLPFDLALHGISFAKQADEDANRITLHTVVTGPAQSLLPFLKALEENPRKLIVRNLSVQVRKNEKGVEAMNLSLTIDAFSHR